MHVNARIALIVFLVLSCLVATIPARAQPSRMEKAGFALPPGLEERINALLEPHGHGDPLPKGWRLTDIEILEYSVRYRFRRGNHSFSLILKQRDVEAPHTSRNFSIHFDVPDGTMPKAQYQSLEKYIVSLVVRNDTGPTPWRKLSVPNTAKQAHTSGFQNPTSANSSGCAISPSSVSPISPTTILKILLVVALFGLATRFQSFLRLARRVPALDRIILGTIILWGLALRLVGGIRIPGWINNHGYGLMNDILVRHQLDADIHGDAFIALYKLVLTVLPSSELTVIGSQVFLSVATIPLVYIVCRFWMQNRNWALWAAAVAAFLPVPIFYAATEVRLVPGIFFLFLTLGTIGWAVRDWHPVVLLSSATLALVTSQFYPTLMIVPLIVLGFILTAPGGRGLFKRTWTWITVGVAGVVWIIPAVWYISLLSTGTGVFGSSYLEVFSEMSWLNVFLPSSSFEYRNFSNVFLNYYLTPPILAILAIVGLLAACRLRASRPAVFMVLACALVFTLSGTIAGRMNTARIQLPALPFYAMLVGIGLEWLANLCSRAWPRFRFVHVLVGTAILGLSILVWPGPIGKKFTPQWERQVVKAGLNNLPVGCTVIYPPQHARVSVEVPQYLSGIADLSIDWLPLENSQISDQIKQKKCLAYYRPPSCYDLANLNGEKTAEPEVSGLIKQCGDIERQLQLDPLYVSDIPAIPDCRQYFSRPSLNIGFFRVVSILGSGI